MKKLLIAIGIGFLLLACNSSEEPDPQDKTQGYLLILNKSGNSAWQLDAETGEQIVEYSTGNAPHEVAVSPDQSRAIITNYGGETAGNSLTILDLDSQEVSKTITLEDFERPHGVQWFSDGERAIITAENQQAVIILNIDSEEIISSVKTNQEVSHMVALGPDEQTAYVTNLGSGSLSILDLTDNKAIETIKSGSGTEGIATVTGKEEVWITNRESDSVSILHTSENNITKTLESTSFPIRAEVSPDERFVAVSNARSSEVSIFDIESRQQIQKVSTVSDDQQGMPIGLTFSADGNRLLVANSNINEIAVIDTGRWEVIDTFSTGETPDGIAYISSSSK